MLVEFNPRQVSAYRLIGRENRLLAGFQGSHVLRGRPHLGICARIA
ncbi:MAG: YfbK domain-containing protein, partial [Longimicrobiales bacterium]